MGVVGFYMLSVLNSFSCACRWLLCLPFSYTRYRATYQASRLFTASWRLDVTCSFIRFQDVLLAFSIDAFWLFDAFRRFGFYYGLCICFFILRVM